MIDTMKLNTAAFTALVLIFISACASPQKSYDRELGTVGAFSEIVNAGVKRLALSSPMSPEEMDEFYPLAVEAAAKYNVEVFREKELIVTELFPADVAAGKEVLLLYQGQTLEAYQKLKADQKTAGADVCSSDLGGLPKAKGRSKDCRSRCGEAARN